MNIIETIKMSYKDGKITITGKKLTGTVRVSNMELMKMYSNQTGIGTISLEIKDEVKPTQPNAN